MSSHTHHAQPDLAIIGPTPPVVYPDIQGLLQSLTDDAARGHVQGLAVVILRDGGAYDLMVRGSAREEGNHMAVMGMLSTLQKSILEVH